MSSEALFVDADQMLYACGFATEGEPLSHATKLLGDKLNKIFDASGSLPMYVFIKGEGNFRYTIDPDYKGTRAARKPKHYDDLYSYIQSDWEAVTVNNVEVDDWVSHLLWNDYVDSIPSVVYSVDKDLKNTPGWHLDDKHDKPYWISQEQADRHFIYQLLAGDRVDNIKGLEGVPDDIKKRYNLRSSKVGEKTAKKIMSETSDVENAMSLCALLYRIHYGKKWWFEMDKNAQLLWMMRDVNSKGLPMYWKNYFSDDVWRVANEWYDRYQKESSYE